MIDIETFDSALANESSGAYYKSHTYKAKMYKMLKCTNRSSFVNNLKRYENKTYANGKKYIQKYIFDFYSLNSDSFINKTFPWIFIIRYEGYK